MRKVILEIAVSLDGFIEGKNGEPEGLVSEERMVYANDFLSGIDTIFYGRVAYEKFGVPPPADPLRSEAERQFYDTISKMRKYVFSRTSKHVEGNGMVIRSNLAAEVKRIRQEDGKDIWLVGGANILSTFIALNLIDEYRITVLPVILGAGKPLFGHITKRLTLRPVKIQNTEAGVMLLHFQPERRTRK